MYQLNHDFHVIYCTALFKVVTVNANWLDALQVCIADGGATLAKIDSAAENTEVQTLLGDDIINLGLLAFNR